MLPRVFLAAVMMTATAGTVLAADVSRPVVTPGPIYTPERTVAGDLSLSVGGIWYGSEHLYNTFNTLGRVNVPLHDTWNLEVEAGGEAMLFGGGASEPYYVDAIAHLWGMHSPTAAWGLYGGAVFGGSPVIGWTGGAEAKHFLSSGSIGLSAGAMRICCTQTFGVFTASYNHYFNPNHRIGVQAGILTNFTYSTWEISADVEHRFMHPVSLFAQASYIGGNFGPSGIWTAKAGVKFYLDDQGDTLQSHEMKVPWTTWVPSLLLRGG